MSQETQPAETIQSELVKEKKVGAVDPHFVNATALGLNEEVLEGLAKQAKAVLALPKETPKRRQAIQKVKTEVVRTREDLKRAYSTVTQPMKDQIKNLQKLRDEGVDRCLEIERPMTEAINEIKSEEAERKRQAEEAERKRIEEEQEKARAEREAALAEENRRLAEEQAEVERKREKVRKAREELEAEERAIEERKQAKERAEREEKEKAEREEMQRQQAIRLKEYRLECEKDFDPLLDLQREIPIAMDISGRLQTDWAREIVSAVMGQLQEAWDLIQKEVTAVEKAQLEEFDG